MRYLFLAFAVLGFAGKSFADEVGELNERVKSLEDRVAQLEGETGKMEVTFSEVSWDRKDVEVLIAKEDGTVMRNQYLWTGRHHLGPQLSLLNRRFGKLKGNTQVPVCRYDSRDLDRNHHLDVYLITATGMQSVAKSVSRYNSRENCLKVAEDFVDLQTFYSSHPASK